MMNIGEHKLDFIEIGHFSPTGDQVAVTLDGTALGA